MSDKNIFKQMEELCVSIMYCSENSEISSLHSQASNLYQKIREYSEPLKRPAITERIETGPAPLGWGKGKDE